MSPIISCQIADLANDRDVLDRVLRRGLEVSVMAVSKLPGNPNDVWTVKKKKFPVHSSMKYLKKKVKKNNFLLYMIINRIKCIF